MSPGQLAPWRARHIGFVFQQLNLLPVLTAYQNVELPLLLTRLSKKERDERIRIALGVVGLEDRMKHYPRQLSGGQEQRVAIARAIVADPTLVLLDEPTGQLDAKSSQDVLALLRRLNDEFKKTIIMVTHDAHAAESRQDGAAPGEGHPHRAAGGGGVKFLHLVLANLGRHKRRTILTTASVALALFLFASLRTVVTTLAAAAQFGSARRLVSTNATGIVFPLPLSYANRLRAVPGVEAVTWANWFGGQYGDDKRFFAQFAVDPESYLEMYPEISLPEDQKQAFLQERGSAIIGRRLVDVFGWKLGQNVTIQGTIFPGDWTFTIRGDLHPDRSRSSTTT